MATDKKSLIVILKEAEVYPDDPSYPFTKSVSTTADKVDYWYNIFKDDWRDFPKAPGKSKVSWSPNSSVNGRGSSWESEWKKKAKKRINDFTKSDLKKSGFKIFREITGYYQIHISDDETIERQQTRLRQLLKLFSKSEYGVIDPLTGKEATLDLEKSDGKINYFFQDLANPSTISYSVLEAEVAPLLMTDTLIESNVRGLIYQEYEKIGVVPNPKSIFPKVMQAGRESQVFERARDNIPQLKAQIQSIIDEMTDMKDTVIAETVSNYVPESPQYGDSGELKSMVKQISLKQFLALKFDNAKSKTQMQNIRPPVDGMKRGKDWPSSDTRDWIVHITQNPVEVMQKSTNKTWSSCESIPGGGYHKGCWDDFGVGNALALYYRASDLLDAEGNFTPDSSKVKGRTVLRWGMARVPNEPNRVPRIGIETRIYSSGIDGSTSKNLSSSLISIMENAGLWDWEGTCNAPYSYGGYLDRSTLNYPKKAQSGQTTGGMQVGDGQAQAIALTYNTQYELSYGELQGILEMNDSDEVLMNLADNPICWNYHRIIGAFVRNIFSMYDEANQETLVNLLLGHEYANPELLIPILESLEVINPNYQNLANLDDTIFRFAHHPRSSSEVFDTINVLMGDDAKIIYGLPAPPNFTSLGGPQWSSFMYCDETFWTPMIDKLLEIDVASIQEGTTPDSEIQEIFSEFSEWYEPVISRWAGLYESAPALVEGYRQSGLGVGIYGANLLASKLLHQPNISQSQYETLLELYLKLNRIILSAEGSYERTLLMGVANLLVLNFNRPDYQGWNLYCANLNEMPPITKQKNYRPRTNESITIMLNHLYTMLVEIGFDETFSYPNTSEFANDVAYIYGGCKNSSEVEMFYNFITQLITNRNEVIVSRIGADDTMELQAKLIPMLFLSAFKRTNIEKKGLRLLPQSAISAIFALLTNNSFGDSYYNAVFYDFIPPKKYSTFIDNLATANDDKIKGERKPTSLSEEMAFNILTNEDVLEEIDLESLARQLPDNEDLFYIMEDVVLSYYLGEMYNPEGEKPFTDLTLEQLNENTEEHFNFKLMIANALTSIADMMIGFMHNENTPDEIIERVIQKPRPGSVGYRRMFDYYGLGEDYLSSRGTGGTFSQDFITPLTKNKNIKGRLLKYLYSNYPEQRTSILMNPNIVEARLYDDLGEEYPLELTKNYEVSKRAYLRHMRKTIEQLRISPTYDFQASFNEWINNQRSWIGNGSFVDSWAEGSVSYINNDERVQFIRAGRCRFSTNLPTAPEGATERNLSRAGSIPDYPQLPQGDNPFVLFRATNFNLRKLNELSGGLGSEYLQAESDGEISSEIKPSVSSQLLAISNLIYTGRITNDNIVSIDSGERESEPETIEGYRPDDSSLFLNRQNITQINSNADAMIIFESEYVVNSDDTYADIGCYTNAELKGIRVGNGYNNSQIASTLNRFGGGATTEINRNALMWLIENSPDGLEFRYDGNTSQFMPFTEGRIYTYPQEVQELMLAEETMQRFLTGNSNLNENSTFTTVISVLVSLFTNPSYLRRTNNTNLHYPEFSIINSTYNLEVVAGWIEPEYRTKLTNYDSKGRFNDRLSAFLTDWFLIVKQNDLPSFKSDISDEEVVEVPSWRLNFSENDWFGLILNLRTAIFENEISYQDYLNVIELMIETVNNDDCVLLPTRTSSSGSDARYGLRGFQYFDYNGIREYLSIPQFSRIRGEDDFNTNQKYPELSKEMFGLTSYLIFGNMKDMEGRNIRNYDRLTEYIYSYIIEYNSSGRWNQIGTELMWNPKMGDEQTQNELIYLLLALDLNETSAIEVESMDEVTADMRAKNQNQKWENLKSFLKEYLKDGLKAYQKYANTWNKYVQPNGLLSSINEINLPLRTSVNNDDTFRFMIPQLFTIMVEGYIQYIQDANNQASLQYQDFILMVRMLNFELPPDYYQKNYQPRISLVNTNQSYNIEVSESQKERLRTLRDNNLPLFTQALRTTTIREDEEFIE